ncbi:transposase [Oleiagrimonas sp.]|jgi:putative transposase|uniref:REP-associated tyrosine transposase n=1 Tax=Oleiagrimonas sp. TaxID=2010330 RepID=UPI00261D3B4E|nr:transposase [Oleiagrimonas sp.]MDA3913807.1 transposase [Oleiagrimonas sp.]
MARPLRLEFAGALYHVTARGDRRESIYEDDTDRRDFLQVLGAVVKRFNWCLHAYCLMDNHYHLLVETPDGNLSKGMRQLNGVFTQHSNRRHHRIGHLFQGRFKAILVQKEAYLLELARYIVLNPVRARMVRRAGDWPWSSYRATVGASAATAGLSSDWILSAFGAKRAQATRAYQSFVDLGRDQPSPWEQLRNQVMLGNDTFVDDLHERMQRLDQPLTDVPKRQRAGRLHSIEEYAAQASDRNEAIAFAYASGGYTLREIGEHFGLHYSRVRRIVKLVEAKGET